VTSRQAVSYVQRAIARQLAGDFPAIFGQGEDLVIEAIGQRTPEGRQFVVVKAETGMWAVFQDGTAVEATRETKH
jgi:hypothetical protein